MDLRRRLTLLAVVILLGNSLDLGAELQGGGSHVTTSVAPLSGTDLLAQDLVLCPACRPARAKCPTCSKCFTYADWEAQAGAHLAAVEAAAHVQWVRDQTPDQSRGRFTEADLKTLGKLVHRPPVVVATAPAVPCDKRAPWGLVLAVGMLALLAGVLSGTLLRGGAR